MALLSIRDLRKYFPMKRLGGRRVFLRAVDGVSLDINAGDIVGLVGESGSGKTTLANCLAGFLEPTSGQILFDGNPLRAGANRLTRARRVQMVFQDPVSALNPRQPIGSTLGEPLLVHGLATKKSVIDRVSEVADMVGIQRGHLERYPHQLNSGQRQRVVIARALTLEPTILVCDEPVSSLDVSTQSQILNVLTDLHERLNLTMVFITHDLSVVRQVANRVAVMYLGKLMEVTDADDFFTSPTHPYSDALVSSTPRFEATETSARHIIKGEIPSPVTPPAGCVFHTRCPEATKNCQAVIPPLREIKKDHLVACINR
jgi:peptide/nickel transport system ATP-binding protein